MIVGSFKKLIVADLLLKAAYPDSRLLLDGAPLLGWQHVLGAAFIRFLITYYDFSGYTDMVLGTTRLFGIRLMENFNAPLSRSSLADFWRCWHISLTSWVRDYVYYPILVTWRKGELALVATMVTIGIWHGLRPGWVLWGLHHAAGLIALGWWGRWAARAEGLRKLRTTGGWKLLGVLAVWYYVALAYSLTIFPDDWGQCAGLYLKILTFGRLG